MPQNVLNQLIEVALAIILGIKLGLIFDFFRILRSLVKRKNKKIFELVTFCSDVLFFFLSFVLSFSFLLETNMGVVRLYVLLAEVAGFFAYIKTASKIIVPLTEKLISLANKILRPVFMIFLKIARFLFIPLLFVKKIFNKLIKKYKFILKRHHMMLYNCGIGDRSSQEEK